MITRRGVNSEDTKSISLLVITLFITVLIYFPALESRFLLDDTYNLAKLTEVESYGISYFVFSGFAGPSGRPLSLLSFALQYQAWPGNPAAFKTVNLIIHLLNGILIWFISLRLARAVNPDTYQQKLIASFCTGLWLLNPIHMSTVLYVVQRMTLLSAFFTLAAILGYLNARENFLAYYNRRNLLVISAYIFSGLILSILCKENGILLPLYIIVIESTLLLGSSRTIEWKKWAAVFLVAPLLILSSYLALKFGNEIKSYEFRSFTAVQRLLTEANVLFAYTKNIIIPNYGAYSLYHDDYPVSTSLLTPLHTLFSVIGLLIAFIAALIFRYRFKVFCFVVLWFISGHLLESTYLNLEIYFEHRNYLPAFGICFGISCLLVYVLKKYDIKKSVGAGISIYFVLVISVSAIEASTWARPEFQVMEWARQHPRSIRALDDLAAIHISRQEYKSANEIFDQIDSLQPGDMYPVIQKIKTSYCRQGVQYNEKQWQEILGKALSASIYHLKIIAGLDSLVGEVITGKCNSMTSANLSGLIRNLTSNPAYINYNGYLFEFLASLSLADKDYNGALNNIKEALHAAPKPEHFLQEIRILKIMGNNAEAAVKIREFKKILDNKPGQLLAYDKLLDSLESK